MHKAKIMQSSSLESYFNKGTPGHFAKHIVIRYSTLNSSRELMPHIILMNINWKSKINHNTFYNWMQKVT